MRWFAAVLLGLYSLFVARLTLADPSSGRVVFALADDVATWLSDGRLTWTETEVLANVVLFVPAGFLLAVVLGRPMLSFALCILASIADIEHNSLGGLLGAVLAWPVARPLSRRRRYAIGSD